VIIARAPLRVSFGGGGTDLPEYYTKSGGLVFSVSIDKYIYVIVEPSRYGTQITTLDEGFQANQTGPPDAAGNRLPLLVTERCAPGESVRILIAGEVPSGTGLGSSSALTVALVAALSELTGVKRSPVEVAELACTIEIEQLGSPIGKQDQYASAVGGMNTLEFHPDGTVLVDPVHLSASIRDMLGRRLQLYFTGNRRRAGSILAQQRRQSEEGDRQTMVALDAIKGLAIDMRHAVLEGDLDRFGHLLHDSWVHKRRVASGISTDFINHCYETARHAGALGGKIAGAGGGGFLLLYCREESQDSLANALKPLGLVHMPFEFSSRGVHITVKDSSLDTDTWQS
jgi:D-glycero-alpha-D-manno-heptose-7-phosphate kinase